MQILMFLLFVFMTMMMLAPELLILFMVGILAVMDWIGFLVTGRHWFE